MFSCHNEINRPGLKSQSVSHAETNLLTKYLTTAKAIVMMSLLVIRCFIEASVFNLSQIGELANKLSTEYKKLYPKIQWQQLYGLRNRILHDYDGVNLVLVWSIIEEDLQEVKILLKEITLQ
jgi:uncharacterized protein with HEPN domain